MLTKIVSCLLAVLLCVTMVVALAGCSSGSSPTTTSQAATTTASSTTSSAAAVTKTTAPAANVTLRIGLMGGLTGPAAPAVNAIITEFGYVFKYINENEGGISGVKLEWKVADNKGTPDGAITAYKELRDGFKPQVYIGIEDYYMLGLKDTFAEDKSLVFATSALDSRIYVPAGRVFGVSMATADGFAALCEWIAKDWTGSGKPKIGMLHTDLPSGLSWKLASNYVSSKVEIAATAPYSMSALDVKPQLMTLRDANVNYMWIQANNQQAAVIIRDFRSLGLMDKIKPIFMEWTEDDKLIELAGDAVEGFYQCHSESPASDGAEAAKLWSQIWKLNTGKDRWCNNRLTMNIKFVLTAAVQKVIAQSGAESLSGETLYNALTTLTSIDTAGNVGNLGYSDTRRMGTSTMKISQYTKTDVKSISDWITLPRIFEGIDK